MSMLAKKNLKTKQELLCDKVFIIKFKDILSRKIKLIDDSKIQKKSRIVCIIYIEVQKYLLSNGKK